MLNVSKLVNVILLMQLVLYLAVCRLMASPVHCNVGYGKQEGSNESPRSSCAQ